MGRVSPLAQSARGDLGEWLLDEGPGIAAILLVAILAHVVSGLVVRRFRRRLSNQPSLTGERNLQRATTLASALSTGFRVAIWVIAVLLVLGRLNVDLAPLLASAGVAGVALGFGAQSIVKDALSGFFILLENQFAVDDVVEIQTTANPVAGKVEDLTLRITVLRAFDGTVHVIPNGNIQVVSNRSREWGRAIVDVRIAYDADVERVRQILERLCDEIEEAGLLDGWLTKRPSVLGVETLGDYAIVVRVVAETLAAKRWDAERRLRELISTRLAREGVRVPLPPSLAQRAGEAGL
jgi:small-conductance mechanosensitive channel